MTSSQPPSLQHLPTQILQSRLQIFNSCHQDASQQQDNTPHTTPNQLSFQSVVSSINSSLRHRKSLKNLNNSVKSNTSFVRKMKSFHDNLPMQQKEGLLKELHSLNCKRYLEEIVDGMLKMDYSEDSTSQQHSLKEISPEDISIIISLAVVLFLRYDTFLEQFQEKLASKSSLLHPRDKLKLFMAIFLIGMGPRNGEKAYEMLRETTQKSTPRSSDLMNTMHTLIMFAENFGDFLFASSADTAEKTQEESTAEQTLPEDSKPTSNGGDTSSENAVNKGAVVPEKVKQKFASIYTEYLQQHLCKRLETGLNKLTEMREGLQSSKFGSSAGISSDTLSSAEAEEAMEKYSKARKSWLKFYDLTQQIAQPVQFEIAADIREKAEEMNRILQGIQEAKEAEAEADRKREEFDDDYTRSFYRTLPDINQLLGEGKKADAATEEKPESSSTATGDDDPLKEKFNSILSDLRKIYGRASFEQWIRDFAPFNSKKNRKKVAQQMYQVNRNSLEMLPHYARLVKIFHPEYPDMAQTLSTLLLDQFHHLFTEKDQIKVESKVKNIRFIGELTKFLLIPVHTTLNILSRCLTDFTHHNINVACALLETCGRFLLLHQESRKRMQSYIAQLARIRNVMTFSDSYELMIENAIYTVNTEATANYSGAARVRLPPIHRYVLHLLYNQLNKKNTRFVTKKLLKLDWNQAETLSMLLETLQDVRMARYDNIHLVASIVKELSQYYPHFAIVVIDRLIEDIRASLAGEIELSSQRRILDVKFFGELFVHQCFEYQLVIDILYMLIRYAPHTDDPQDTLRVRLVCTLLDAIAQSFTSVPAKKQRARFLLYLQDYVLRREYRLPVDTEFMLADTLDHVDRSLRWPKSKQESARRISRLEKMRPIPLPSEDRLFPITKNPVTSENYDFDDEEFENIINLEEEKEKKLVQQSSENKLEDLKFEREVQQMVQQDATERRMQRKPVQMSVKDMLSKMKSGSEKPSGVINLGSTGKKMFVMRRKAPAAER